MLLQHTSNDSATRQLETQESVDNRVVCLIQVISISQCHLSAHGTTITLRQSPSKSKDSLFISCTDLRIGDTV